MSATPLLLLGAGGHARSCIDVIEQEASFQVAGLVGLPGEVGDLVLGYPVLGTDDDLPSLFRDYAHALVTIGQIKSPEVRIRLFEAGEKGGCRLPVIVSPRAYVSKHATLGAGTIVMHGAVVNAGVTIGRNCIVNSQALVEHDSVVGDHCHLSTGVVINSGVRVGTGTFIGSNASVRQGVRVGDRCVVAMGRRVLKDFDKGPRVPAS